MEWTEAEEAQLRQLVAERKSASKIGQIMGRTRASISRKCDRMGLKLLGKPVANPNKPKRVRNRSKSASAPRVVVPPPPPPPVNPDAILGVSRAVLALKYGQCKWPMGEGETFHFCAAPAQGSYCDFHRAKSTIKDRQADKVAWALRNPTLSAAKRILEAQGV